MQYVIGFTIGYLLAMVVTWYMWSTKVRSQNESIRNLANRANEQDEEIEKLRDWIFGLDEIAVNNGDHREWAGSDIGWVYPGHAAYYGKIREDEALDA